MKSTQVAGYSALQILLHWIVAMLVLFQLFFGESMTTVVDAGEEGTPAPALDVTLATAHYWVGIAILCLVAARLMLRIAYGAPEPAGISPLTALAAKAAHWLFYVLLVAVPATGLLAVYVSGDFGDIHALGKPAFIVLIVLHAAAALYHQFLVRDGTLRRMLVPARSRQSP